MPDKLTEEERNRRQKKTVSVRKLAERIRGLRQKVSHDMDSDDEKQKLIATVVAVIDRTAERVGNDDSAKGGHVGVTGLQKKHVSISGDTVKLKYTGKSGVEHEKEFTDKRIAGVLKEYLKRAKESSDFLFTTKDGLKIKGPQVNNYLSEYEVTAKDLRGYAANHMVIQALRGRDKSSDEAERKKTMSDVLKQVAEKVGHGKGTLRKHYLLPGIEDEYVKRSKMPSIKNASVVSVAQNFYMPRICEAVAHRHLAGMIQPVLMRLKEFVDKKYEDVFGDSDDLPDRIDVRVKEVSEDKIGSYRYDSANHRNGLLTVSPRAFEQGPEKVCWVILHELAHAAMGRTQDSDRHGPKFRKLADALGLPDHYQD